jgi:hypothetical protein
MHTFPKIMPFMEFAVCFYDDFCRQLDTYAGGIAKEGWMYKEAQNIGGWSRRWMVLWPQTPHPQMGQLLFYYKNVEDKEARGVIRILAPVIKAPKTPRPDYYCIRLNAQKVHGDGGIFEPYIEQRKFILGTDEEHDIKAWIESFRACRPKWHVSQEAPSCVGWLLKQGAGQISWWKKRWVELRGTKLSCCFDNEDGGEVKGVYDLSKYDLFMPQPEQVKRDRVFMFIPKPDTEPGESGAAAKAHYFSAETDDEFDKWSVQLRKQMAMASEAAALSTISLSTTFGSVSSRASTTGGELAGVSPEDFDVMNVIGKGGFGKVLLVRRKPAGPDGQLLAMKMMDKTFIIQQEQQRHVNDEVAVLKRVQHPFIVGLECAFQVFYRASCILAKLVRTYHNERSPNAGACACIFRTRRRSFWSLSSWSGATSTSRSSASRARNSARRRRSSSPLRLASH